MIVKYFNLYFVFFSIALSAAIFPSTLGNYSGFIIPLGFGTFILDELIILVSLAFMFLYVVRTQKISHKIGGYGNYLIAFLLFIVALFYLSLFRTDNSLEIISRDRWIVLNALAILLPFVYKPSMNDLKMLYKHFAIFLVTLTALKLSFFLIIGPKSQFSQFGPGFLFMLSLCLAIYLWSGGSRLKKAIFSLIVLLVSILSQQLSALLLTLMSIFTPIYFSISIGRYKAFMLLIIAGFIVTLFLVSINLVDILLSLNLNPLNFTIVEKLVLLVDLWTAPFINISPIEFFFGRGAGYSTQMLVYNEGLDEFTVVNQSLAHNFLVTLFMKFGLVGLLFFSAIIFSIFMPFSHKFKFENSTLLKIILSLILFNFLSTPGIWKIRKGIFLWFIVGLIYFYRKYRFAGVVKSG